MTPEMLRYLGAIIRAHASKDSTYILMVHDSEGITHSITNCPNHEEAALIAEGFYFQERCNHAAQTKVN